MPCDCLAEAELAAYCQLSCRGLQCLQGGVVIFARQMPLKLVLLLLS